MTSSLIFEARQIYIDWHVNIVIDLIDQILKSPELISDTNTINPLDISTIKNNQKKIASSALEKEVDYLIKQYKIKNKEGLYKVIGKLEPQKIDNLRRKFLNEAIRENLKNG